MQFYPKQAGLEKPGFGPGLTLAGVQVACGVVVAVIQSFLPGRGNAGISAVGAVVGAMSYASWAETKVPGALSQRSMSVRLALFATWVQIVLAGAYTLALVELGPADLTAGMDTRLFLMLIPVGAIFCFLATWLGLWQGRRMVEKQRHKQNPSPPPQA